MLRKICFLKRAGTISRPLFTITVITNKTSIRRLNEYILKGKKSVLSHHWADLLSHRPALSSCQAHARELPAACVEEWSPHHPAVEEETQM